MCLACNTSCEGDLCQGCIDDVYTGSDDAMAVVTSLIAHIRMLKVDAEPEQLEWYPPGMTKQEYSDFMESISI